jgi:L-cysteine/cystine lyase
MNIEKIREYFPQFKNVIYFNTGSSGPLPVPVIEEIMRYMEITKNEGSASPLLYDEIGKLNLRHKIADFLKVREHEICLTHSTSDGLGIVFSGIDWKKGDEIVAVYPEYISGMLDCQNIEKQYGVKLKIVKTDEKAFIVEEKIIKEINEKTKLVLISHVNYHNGQRLDCNKICKSAKEKNSMVIIDGAQSVGAIPVNIKDIDPDFYVFPAQKWLLGEEGMGGLYVKKEALSHINPGRMGYNSVEKFSPSEGFILHRGARRFEVGTPCTASYFAFSGAIDFYNMIGEEFICSRIEKLASYLKEKLYEIKGVNIITPIETEKSSGLVSFTIQAIDMNNIVTELYRSKKIIIRSIPYPECLRISVHYFNTEEEIDILIEALKNYIY